MRLPAFVALVALTAAIANCSSSDSNSTPGAVAGACSNVAIDRFKELEIVDESVTTDTRAKNKSGGPWSFRHQVEALATPGNVSEFLVRWLRTWSQDAAVNLFPVPARVGVERMLICPWLRGSADNACNEDCSTCAKQTLDPALAPFRLIGVVNRLDLINTDADPEGRLVYGLTNGPGDDPASQPLQMTVIFEYHLDLSKQSPSAWATKWHRLGSFAMYDEPYKAALQGLTDEFTTSRNFQVRTNERVFDWQWQLREYHMEGGVMAVSGTANTPDVSVNSSAALSQWLNANRTAVLANRHHLPPLLLGGEATIDTTWVAQVDEPLRKAFAKETCNGCHHSEVDSFVDINFQLSPLRVGRDRVSRFLHNPDDLEHDELAARSRFLQENLCAAP